MCTDRLWLPVPFESGQVQSNLDCDNHSRYSTPHANMSSNSNLMKFDLFD